MNVETIPASKNKIDQAKDLPEIEIGKLDSSIKPKIKEGRKEDTILCGRSISQNSKADEVANARQTLEHMNGQATTPENERKVREARAILGEAVDNLPDDIKKAVDEGQEKDSILNDQVADGHLNLNQVENRIVEFETH